MCLTCKILALFMDQSIFPIKYTYFLIYPANFFSFFFCFVIFILSCEFFWFWWPIATNCDQSVPFEGEDDWAWKNPCGKLKYMIKTTFPRSFSSWVLVGLEILHFENAQVVTTHHFRKTLKITQLWPHRTSKTCNNTRLNKFTKAK